MENYVKGQNVEPSEDENDVPFDLGQDNFVHVRIKGGTKMRNVVGFVIKSLDEEDSKVVLSGHGPALNKVISCAEVVKRK